MTNGEGAHCPFPRAHHESALQASLVTPTLYFSQFILTKKTGKESRERREGTEKNSGEWA